MRATMGKYEEPLSALRLAQLNQREVSNEPLSPSRSARLIEYEEITTLLLANGAEDTPRLPQDVSDFLIAGRESNIAVVKELLKRDLDVTAADPEGLTVLMVTAVEGLIEDVERLIQLWWDSLDAGS